MEEVPVTIEQKTRIGLETQTNSLLEEVRLAMGQGRKALSNENALLPLTQTLNEFARYSRDYFNVFKSRGKIEEMQKALEKIQREWLVLRPLLEQRLMDHHLAPLRNADAVARDLIQMGAGGDDDDEYGVLSKQGLTFFEKTFSIARFAYSRVPGVAVPMVNREAPWFWAGIAHEIGHYHFWNAEGELDKQLDAALLRDIGGLVLAEAERPRSPNYDSIAAQPALWREWKEELFADVFGALSLGPAYVRSLMLWLRSRVTAETILANDQDHPIALLRPLMLAQMAEDDERIQIENDWKAFCASLAPDKTFDSWLGQVLEASRVSDCLDFAPTAVNAAAALIKSALGGTARYYNASAHQRVKAAAAALADGSAPGDSLRPAAKVSAAWYAWESVVAGSLSSDEKERRLNVIRAWFAQPAQSSFRLRIAGQLFETREVIDSEKARLLGVWTLAEDQTQWQESESFGRWKKTLAQESPGPVDDVNAKRLLENEMSTQEEVSMQVAGHKHASSQEHFHYHPA
jgi:hypothetical protein